MEINLPKLKQAMIAQVHKNDILANNLANLENTGFKREVAFFEMLDPGDKAKTRLGVYTDFSQGDLKQTDNPFDVAILGRGFFAVQTANGTAYTRDGHFRLDANGVLKTPDGDPVLGEQGEIFLSTNGLNTGSVSFKENGEIYVNGTFVDQLKISDFEQTDTLKKIGGNLFVMGPETLPAASRDFRVEQGFIEEANVNPVEEMVGLIEMQREFESSQRVVKTLDELFRSAASQVGQYQR